MVGANQSGSIRDGLCNKETVVRVAMIVLDGKGGVCPQMLFGDRNNPDIHLVKPIDDTFGIGGILLLGISTFADMSKMDALLHTDGTCQDYILVITN